MTARATAGTRSSSKTSGTMCSASSSSSDTASAIACPAAHCAATVRHVEGLPQLPSISETQ